MAAAPAGAGARRSSHDPDVDSLSSFIGVDGTNSTLNSGRFLINLKPRDERSASASDIIRRLQAGDGAGRRHRALHAAGAGPHDRRHGEPHAVPVRARGRQPDRARRLGPEAAGTAASSFPQLEDVASDVEAHGLSTYVDIDRDTAARFGITPATVDNALYDAFGQRIVSTIFTQSNQYRVILEATPQQQRTLDSLNAIYLPSSLAAGGQVPLSAIARFIPQERAAPDQPSRPVPRGDDLLQPGAAGLARRGGERDPRRRAGDRHAGERLHQLPGRGARLPGLARATSCCSSWPRSSPSTSCWACSTRATSTRSRSSPPCPRPASARCWR